jgi:pimeloyl-ACP methyl ester carboxylesterase
MPTFFQPAYAAPGISAEELDRYHRGKNSPLAGQGQTLVESGRQWNVDPRLVVAIAGAESTFGTRVCAEYNAWNWFYKDTANCSANAFSSWQEGIERVTRGLRQLYLDHGRTTIPKIAEIYTTTERETWIHNVTLFYQAELGGDPNDLTFQESLEPSPAPIERDRKIVLIAGVMSYNLPSDPAAVNGWAAIRSAIQHDSSLGSQLQDEDFLYFSYSGFYVQGSSRFSMPFYKKEDTFPSPSNVPSSLSHTVPFEALLLDNLIDEFPESEFDLIGHSLGGVIATYWAATQEDADKLKRVRTIITLGSPLKGMRKWWYGAIAPDVLDLEPDSELVQTLQKTPAKVRVFTIRTEDDQWVDVDDATLMGVWRDLRGKFGDHSQIKAHPQVKAVIVHALSERRVPPLPPDLIERIRQALARLIENLRRRLEEIVEDWQGRMEREVGKAIQRFLEDLGRELERAVQETCGGPAALLVGACALIFAKSRQSGRKR